ncbi:MAG: hypothetical protein WCD79_03850 [Chthoniobacteraceae bacterium]
MKKFILPIVIVVGTLMFALPSSSEAYWHHRHWRHHHHHWHHY